MNVDVQPEVPFVVYRSVLPCERISRRTWIKLATMDSGDDHSGRVCCGSGLREMGLYATCNISDTVLYFTFDVLCRYISMYVYNSELAGNQSLLDVQLLCILSINELIAARKISKSMVFVRRVLHV